MAMTDGEDWCAHLWQIHYLMNSYELHLSEQQWLTLEGAVHI